LGLKRSDFNTNINLKPYNGLEQLRRKEAKRRVGNIGRIENDWYKGVSAGFSITANITFDGKRLDNVYMSLYNDATGIQHDGNSFLLSFVMRSYKTKMHLKIWNLVLFWHPYGFCQKSTYAVVADMSL